MRRRLEAGDISKIFGGDRGRGGGEGGGVMGRGRWTWDQYVSPNLCKVENAAKEPFKHEEPLCCTNQVEKNSLACLVIFLTLVHTGQVQEV